MKNDSVFQVGITGGIGSGKSTVCKAFQALGIPIYDADSSAKWLMEHDNELVDKIKEAFGTGAYAKDGQLNRLYMRTAAFASQEQTDILNSLVHPQVGKHYAAWVNEHLSANYLVKEAALMFESNSHLALHCIVAVSAPESIRITRVHKRDKNRTLEQIQAILNRQWSDQQREDSADFCILNSGEIPLLQQIINLHTQFSDPALQAHYGVQKPATH